VLVHSGGKTRIRTKIKIKINRFNTKDTKEKRRRAFWTLASCDFVYFEAPFGFLSVANPANHDACKMTGGQWGKVGNALTALNDVPSE
jgi:hypothetical protein